MNEIQISTTDSGAQIDLPGVLDMRAASGLKAALQQAVSGGQPLTVKASTVERLSTPCAQVLIAGQQAMVAANLGFKLSEPSDPFIDAFNDLGLFPVLKQWDIE